MPKDKGAENGEELPFEINFIEQAEYIEAGTFLDLAIEHPEEDSILRKLMGGGAKLLIGPRGCGKSTLMLKAFYSLLNQKPRQALPIYVNYKLALKIEPLYTKGPNAPYWFRGWLVLRVLQALHETSEQCKGIKLPHIMPSKDVIAKTLKNLETGNISESGVMSFDISYLKDLLDQCLTDNDLSRCVILIDDAAHAFSDKQQEDFFDFFRSIKSRTISPKAAVYPGVTSHSPSFQIGHDAEQIDVWMKPSGATYENFMIELAKKRLFGTSVEINEKNQEDFIFLAYSSFGIPRAFLGMLRTIYNSPETHMSSDGTLVKTKVLQLARSGREMSQAVYSSLEAKLPSYRSYVENGRSIYNEILSNIKNYNLAKKDYASHAIQFGVRKPIDPNLEKVFGFFQYAGLVMPAGDVLRGENGTFSIFDIHIGDLVAENAIVGGKAKSVANFLSTVRASKHQAWPRTYSAKIMEAAKLDGSSFYLSLPQCQSCGAERASPEARFCTNCGSQLKASSTYEALVDQDISVLQISKAMQKRIKDNSQFKKVRDILIDSSREQLLSIKYIGKARATKIVGAAEEYVS